MTGTLMYDSSPLADLVLFELGPINPIWGGNATNDVIMHNFAFVLVR